MYLIFVIGYILAMIGSIIEVIMLNPVPAIVVGIIFIIESIEWGEGVFISGIFLLLLGVGVLIIL